MSHVISLLFPFWQSTQGHLVIYMTKHQLFNFLLMPNAFSRFLVNLWLLLPELWSELSMTYSYSYFLLCLLCSSSFSNFFFNSSQIANCAQIFVMQKIALYIYQTWLVCIKKPQQFVAIYICISTNFFLRFE